MNRTKTAADEAIEPRAPADPARRSLAVAALGAGIVAALRPRPANAADAYPARAVRLLVGFAPGGGNDILARQVALRLTDRLGQSVLVENRPGASGVLAVEAVRQAGADGHTLLVAPSSSMTVNPVLMRNLSYDPRRDLASIGLLGRFPLVLVVHPSNPARSVRELIDQARAEPGRIAYAAASTSYQLATEMFAQAAGIQLLHVPYKGSAPAIQAVAANEVPMAIADVATVNSLVKAGRLRALGVTTAAPTRTMPGVPTLAAEGVPGYDASVWAGLFGPASIDRAAVARLQAELAAIAAQPDTQQKLVELGIEPATSTAEELRALIVREIDAYTEIARRANIQPQ
ncbi:MAG: Bug family tripartite tricarboxylate transporter substrate binding protein [Lautropia sp.]